VAGLAEGGNLVAEKVLQQVGADRLRAPAAFADDADGAALQPDDVDLLGAALPGATVVIDGVPRA
jgi:hypothetical protein